MTTRSRAFILASVVLLIAYAIVLFHHTSRSVGGSDSSGYLNAARLLASGHASEPIRGLERLGLPQDLARVFVPLGYTPLEQPGRMAPSYPPGLPLHMALAASLGGWAKAPFFVSPIAGIACLVLMYLLGRELRLPPIFAFAGSALLAFFPTFVFQALQSMSDVLATAWALAAVFAAYKSRARRSPAWAALAGLACGIGILVRPTNALLLAPVAAALPLRSRAWLSFVAGALPPAIFLLAYNGALFGSPWSTGYGSAVAEGMAWENFPERARHYGYWIARLFSPILPLGWLALIADRKESPTNRVVLLSWFGSFFLFFSFYAVYDAWWYTRFLLPGVPAMILGSFVVARDLLPRNPSRARLAAALAALLLAAVLFVEIRYIDRNRVHKFYKGDQIYPRACKMARRRLQGNAIVVSMQMSGALHYYTPITYLMWSWLPPERFADLRASTESRGHKWYALLAPFEVPEVSKNLPGEWQAIDRTGDVVLWELSPAPR